MFSAALPNEVLPQYFGAATNVMLLAANGYAVLLPSLPQGLKGAPQSTLIADVGQALDAAITTGLVDPARIAVEGHSYGGINELHLAARSRRFSAVIAQSGMSDMAGGYGTLLPAERDEGRRAAARGRIAWFESGQGGFGFASWQDAARYQAASPFFSADRMSALLLLVA